MMHDIKENFKTKKYLVGSLLCVVVILVFGYMQLGWFGGTTESDTDWLVVLHAGEAKITEVKGETFLTLKEISRNTILFSDRPERKYYSMSTHEFLAEWDTLFVDSPPNVALVHSEAGIDTEVVVVELFKPTIRFGRIHFPIKIIGGDYTKDKTYEDVNLFIDSAVGDWFIRIVAARNPSGTSKPTKDTPTFELDLDPESNLKKLAKAVNFDGWEENLQESLVGAITLAADIGGDAGEAGGGGEKGRQIGRRVGVKIGTTAISTAIKAILRSDIDGGTSLDVEVLSEDIKEAVENAVSNLAVAYTLANSILDAQEENIKILFLDALNKLSAEYNKSTFCGVEIDKDNILFDAFMYYLRLDLEGRIYHDLQNGMTADEIEKDIISNLYDDIEYVLLLALWELKDYCIYDENDLYTQMFYELYVFQYTATSEFPELGGVIVDGVIVPVEGVSGTYQRVPLQGPSGVEYYTPAQEILYRQEVELRVQELMEDAERRYEAKTGISPSEVPVSVSQVYAAEIELELEQALENAVDIKGYEPLEVTAGAPYNPAVDLVGNTTLFGTTYVPYEGTLSEAQIISNISDVAFKSRLNSDDIVSLIKNHFEQLNVNISDSIAEEITIQNNLLLESLGYDPLANSAEVEFITEEMLVEIINQTIEETVAEETAESVAN